MRKARSVYGREISLKKEYVLNRQIRRTIDRFLIGLASAAMILLACDRSQKSVGDTSAGRIPDSILEQATITLTSAGIKEAVIFAETLFVYQKEDSIVGRAIEVEFYDEMGEYRSTLTSDEGLIRQHSQALSVWGSVMVSSDSSQLLTESLDWDPTRKLIVTDRLVHLIRSGDTISGYGMEADSRLQNVKILRNVKGRVVDIPKTEAEWDSLEGKPAREEVP